MLTDWLTHWRTSLHADWLTGRMTDMWTWHVDRLTDLLTGMLMDWLTYSVTVWLADWLTDLLTNWLTYWLINYLTYWLTVQLADWLTDWLADWHTYMLSDWLTDMQNYRWSFWDSHGQISWLLLKLQANFLTIWVLPVLLHCFLTDWWWKGCGWLFDYLFRLNQYRVRVWLWTN